MATGTPIVVEYAWDFGDWTVARGNREIFDTYETKSDAVDAALDRDNTMDPGVVVFTKDGESSEVYLNSEFWYHGHWTDTISAPVVVEPTESGNWAIRIGQWSIVDHVDTKQDAIDEATINAGRNDRPVVVVYNKYGSRDRLIPMNEFWESRWG